VNSALLRTLLVYGIILPLAVLVGWMLSSPLETESLTIVGVIVFVLLLPLLFKHHFALLVFSWNATIIVFFLPGQPSFWCVMVLINLAMAVGYRILQRRPLFTHVPMLTFSWLVLAAVVVITAKVRGGIGVRSLGGDSYGGKQYFYVIMGILGYFAWASNLVVPSRIQRFTNVFFLSGTTAIISNIIYYFPPLWSLYLIFPANMATGQAVADYFQLDMVRIGSFSLVGGAIAHCLLARFGLRGVFNIRHPIRLIVVTSTICLTALSGYRSNIVLLGLVLAFLFILEGLLFSRWFFVALIVGAITFASIIPIAHKLPLSLQRTLTVLPIDLDPGVRMDAQASIEWRLMMWQAMTPDLPKYFWLGKGYTINPVDLYLTEYAVRRGLAPGFEGAIIAGDYHNGPLSVYVPFGMPGVLAFLGVLIAGGRSLWLNYKFGNGSLRTLNRFLLALFIAKTVFFLFAFGSLPTDLMVYAGVIGASVSLNRGVCRKPVRESTSLPAAAGVGLEPSAA
jgi:hypothetical protein